jgi:hypothetical protein
MYNVYKVIEAAAAMGEYYGKGEKLQIGKPCISKVQ